MDPLEMQRTSWQRPFLIVLALLFGAILVTGAMAVTQELRQHMQAYHKPVLEKLDGQRFALFAAAYQPRTRTNGMSESTGRAFSDRYVLPSSTCLPPPSGNKKGGSICCS